MSHLFHGRRALLAALAAASTTLGLAAPAFASDGVRQLTSRTPLTCSSGAGARPADDVLLTIYGSAPVSAAPGEQLAFSVRDVQLTKFDAPNSTNPSPFISGAVQSIKLSVDGGAPSTFDLGGGSFGKTAHDEFAKAYGPIRVQPYTAYGDRVITAGSGPAALRVDSLQYGYFDTTNISPTSLPVVPAGITCIPKADSPPVATILAADTTPKQAINASVAMTCTAGGQPTSDVVVGVKGTVPQSTAPGRQILLSEPRVTLQVLDGAKSPSNGIWGAIQGLSITAEGASPTVVQLGAGNFPFTPHETGGYAPVPLSFFNADTPITVTAQGPVVLQVESLTFGYAGSISASSPVPPFVPFGISCMPKDGQPALATIPVAAPPVALPVVSRVYGSAWAGFGGLVRVHGTGLAGAKYVTFGTKKVRPLLVLGSTDVWVLAPALPKGTYPVAVGNATAVSLPGAGNSTTITYR